jgi:FkbM family methyltransferase
MREVANKIVKRVFSAAGLKVQRVGAPSALVWMQSMGIRTVIDVGANEGQFAALSHDTFPEARIYSFEPLADCFAELQARMKGISGFAAFDCALGEADGEQDIHRSAYSPASSLLAMDPLCTDAFPHTKGGTTERIHVKRLDDVARGLQIDLHLLLKIDVQGFEDKVILGGQETLEKARLVLVETSFARLYEGQPLFGDIFQMLSARGFTYQGNFDQLANPNDGRPLQADALFLRG